MSYLRDESAVTLKDESANVLIDENGAEGATLTCTAGSIAITGGTATLQVNTPLNAVAGSVAITGGTATLLESEPLTATAGSIAITGGTVDLQAGANLTATAGSIVVTGGTATLIPALEIVATAGAIAITGNVVTLTTSADTARRTGGGYPWETGPAKRVDRKERRDRAKELDRLIEEAMNPPAEEPEAAPAEAVVAEPVTALPKPLDRAALIREVQRRAREERLRVSLKVIEARLDEMLRLEAEEDEALTILLLAS